MPKERGKYKQYLTRNVPIPSSFLRNWTANENLYLYFMWTLADSIDTNEQ